MTTGQGLSEAQLTAAGEDPLTIMLGWSKIENQPAAIN